MKYRFERKSSKGSNRTLNDGIKRCLIMSKIGVINKKDEENDLDEED